MASWQLEFRPRLPRFVFWLVWIIPIILLPIGLSMYQNNADTGQLITLLVIALVFPIIIYALLKAGQKAVQTDCMIIIENRILTVKRKEETKEVDLNEVDSISIHSKMGFATEFRAKKYKGESVSLTIAGTIAKEDIDALRQIFKEADVKLT